MNRIQLTNDSHRAEPCVATVGFFDGVHRGHQYLISQMQQVAAIRHLSTVSVVTFDRHPRQVLHADYQPQLLSSLEEKEQLLSRAGVNNMVVLNFDKQMAQLSARQFMEQVLRDRLGVRVLLTGYDNHFGHRGQQQEGFHQYVDYGRELGIEVVEGLPLFIGEGCVSSSLVRRLLYEGNVEEAAKCLGRCYSLTGQVVDGHHIGRHLGFPTANLRLSSEQKLVPMAGVYGVRCHIDSAVVGGMMNIGTRPTFGGNKTTLEVHLFGIDTDLYGRQLTVDFVFRQRQEQRFGSACELERQLQLDAEAISCKLRNL